MYLIKKISEISGVSVRTLHYYDEIGLLSPKKYENGYRYYSDEDISILQLVLFYKYLGFSLKDIKKMIKGDQLDILANLKKQLSLMKKEKYKLMLLIKTLENTINVEERKLDMDVKEKFKGFTYKDNEKYREEAIKKYGNKVIEESIEKQKGKEQEVIDEFNNIFFSFSENLLQGLESNSIENIELAKKLHKQICKYGFDCKIDIFSKIGYGYVYNEEFKNNLDKFGNGVAQYVCDAIQEYVKKNKK
ncbi:MerR family transcriptional regulator [Streptobacillus canis]|uniref:MerR family transcriptional regulator n=1 Tax=Streptobacillus canis TaxID=2678686 RepID=UPI0012E25429|nr:MerR family transcriptional regulator [Streptobacillus canis]